MGNVLIKWTNKFMSLISNAFHYPIALALIIGYTCYLLSIYEMDNTFSSRFAIHYMFIGGYSLSMLFFLWPNVTEKKYKYLIIGCFILFLLIDGCLLLKDGIKWNNNEIIISRFSIISLWIILCLCIPFIKNKTDEDHIHFIDKLFTIFCVSLSISLITLAALCFLLYTVKTLLMVELNFEKITVYLYILCIVFLSNFLFLSLFPSEAKRLNQNVNITSFYKKVNTYLFFPILLLGLVIMYIYLAKIIWLWTLPKGWISVPVSIIIFITILWQYLYYNIDKNQPIRLLSRSKRIIPLLCIPLLILMSISIIRRLNDYGISINRLYILIFNVWAYCVCLYLTIKKSARLHYIPLSFVFLFVLSSFGPQSVYKITKHSIKSDLNKMLVIYHYDDKLPLSKKQIENLFNRMSTNDLKDFIDKLRYLYVEFGNSELRDYSSTSWDFIFKQCNLNLDNEVYHFIHNKDAKFQIPSNATSFEHFTAYGKDSLDSKKQIIYNLKNPCKDYPLGVYAILSQNQLREIIQRDSLNKDIFTCKPDNYQLIIDKIELQQKGEERIYVTQIEGFLFEVKK